MSLMNHDSKCLSTADEAKVATCEGANRAEKRPVPQFQALNVSDSEGETRKSIFSPFVARGRRENHLPGKEAR